jgi:hypothetical protein
VTIPDSPGRFTTRCEAGLVVGLCLTSNSLTLHILIQNLFPSDREQGSCETRGGPHVRAIYLEETHQAPQQRHLLCKSGVRNGGVARNGARQCLNHRGCVQPVLVRVSVTPIPPRRLVRGYKPPPLPSFCPLSHRPRLTDPLSYSG